MNEYGTFIGMKLMRFVQGEDDPFFQEIYYNFIMLSQTEKGLNVIKSFIQELKDKQAQTKIISLITANSIGYIEDPYSNYAFQNIMKQWPQAVTQSLCPLILTHILQLSVQQCSSNVVETMLFNSPPDYRTKYIQEVLSKNDISSMMVNRFGSFVLLKMINICSSGEKLLLIESIKRSLNSVNSAKIKAKWNKICDKHIH